MSWSAEGLREQLCRIDRLGWDSEPGEVLLAEVRARIVRPLVARAGLVGPAAQQAESTAWATAWEVLRRPQLRSAENPAGVVWVAVRRAVRAEGEFARWGGLGNPRPLEPERWSGPPEVGEAWVPPGADRSVSEALVVSGVGAGSSTGAGAGVGEQRLGPLLELVLDRLAEAGWDRRVAADLVADLSETAVTGGAGLAATRWRWVARAHRVSEWRVRRLASLLTGGPGGPGILEVMVHRGPDVLEDACAARAVVATTRRWDSTPDLHLSGLTRPVDRTGPTSHTRSGDPGSACIRAKEAFAC